MLSICREFLSDRWLRFDRGWCWYESVDPYRFRRATRKCIGSSSVYTIYQRNVWAGWEHTVCLCRWLHATGSCPQASTDLLLLPPLAMTWLGLGVVQSLVHYTESSQNYKALVVCRSRTVNNPHGNLLFSGVSIQAKPNLTIPTSSLTESSSLKTMWVVYIVFRASQRIGILRLVTRYLWTPLCYFVAILHCCPNPWVLVFGVGVSCWMSPSASWAPARCIRWPGFVLIRVSCRCVIDVMLLSWISCTRSIQTLITVFFASLHLLPLKIDILELRPQRNHCSLKYQGAERPNLQCVSCRPRFVCRMTSPKLSFIPEIWLYGFKGAVNRW